MYIYIYIYIYIERESALRRNAAHVRRGEAFFSDAGIYVDIQR